MEQTEDFIQQSMVIWFNNNYCLRNQQPRCLIMAIPNGGRRDAREAKTFKNTGLLPGASDLEVIIPGKNLYVEVKTKIGTQSIEQKEFEIRVKELGFEYHLVRSLDEFKELIYKQDIKQVKKAS